MIEQLIKKLKEGFGKFKSHEAENAQKLLKEIYGTEMIFNEPANPYISGVYDPNPEFNAFLHAFESAKLARNWEYIKLGSEAVNLGGGINEIIPEMFNPRSSKDLKGQIQDILDDNRDYYNNNVGKRIGLKNPRATDKELAKKVKEAIDRGELITDLWDKECRIALELQNKGIDPYREAKELIKVYEKRTSIKFFRGEPPEQIQPDFSFSKTYVDNNQTLTSKDLYDSVVNQVNYDVTQRVYNRNNQLQSQTTQTSQPPVSSRPFNREPVFQHKSSNKESKLKIFILNLNRKKIITQFEKNL
ncbi:MAG: hypothetical protein PHV68_09835 [Candidatus Gastranaerophilales bacterium]|nr:hypothetical protein [Candidatus Gastranaerophilales bacterium]